jgi:hypothetical protein
LGVALGATVFRTDIAQATGLAQSVTIDNTAANPVPVLEQGVTQVLFDQRMVVGDNDFATVDIKGARDVRIYALSAQVGCPDALSLSVSEGSNPQFFLDPIIPNCGLTVTRLLELPGRTLHLGLLGTVGDANVRCGLRSSELNELGCAAVGLTARRRPLAARRTRPR